MDIQLQISPTTAPLIKNALKERLEVVASELDFKREELNQLETEKRELENQIKDLDNAIMGTKSVVNGYNSNTTVVEKIKYVLKHSDQPLSSREISERLISIEPNLGGANRSTTFKNVSTLLSINKGEGKAFKRIEKEGEENKFALN